MRFPSLLYKRSSSIISRIAGLHNANLRRSKPLAGIFERYRQAGIITLRTVPPNLSSSRTSSTPSVVNISLSFKSDSNLSAAMSSPAPAAEANSPGCGD